MKAKLSISIVLIVTTFFLVNCKGNSEQAKQQSNIEAKEKKLYEDKTESIDNAKAIDMERTYLEYADKYPTDSLSAEYLFRAAEIAENANHAGNAINYLTRIEENFPNYKNYPLVIFKKAYVYENCMKNNEMAKVYYEKFIASYPNHELVEAAQASIIYLGISDKELINIMQQISKQ